MYIFREKLFWEYDFSTMTKVNFKDSQDKIDTFYLKCFYLKCISATQILDTISAHLLKHLKGEWQ